MRIALCSSFRNARCYIPRYVSQTHFYRQQLERDGHSLHCIWCEGDSTDGTYDLLRNFTEGFEFSVDLFQLHHGGPEFGPVVDAQRFQQLAMVWSAIWSRIPEDVDRVLFVESDLHWDSDTLRTLTKKLDIYPALAPMILEYAPPHRFYDIWAFAKNGRNFEKDYPYHPHLKDWPVRVDSAGSCVAFRGELARKLVWRAEDLIVGLCRQVYESGFCVALDPQLVVYHP